MLDSQFSSFEQRRSVIEFIPEQITDFTYSVRFTTEHAFAANPGDEGFVLDIPRAQLKILATKGARIRATVSPALNSACEIDGLVILPPRA